MSDDITNPTVLDPGGGSMSFDMTGATPSIDEGYTWDLPDLWYSWTPNLTGIAEVRFTAITLNLSQPAGYFYLVLFGAAPGVEFFHGTWAEMTAYYNNSPIYNRATIRIEYDTQDQLGAAAMHVTAGHLYMLRLVDTRAPTSTVTGTFAWSLHEPMSPSDPGPVVGTQDILIVRPHNPSLLQGSE